MMQMLFEQTRDDGSAHLDSSFLYHPVFRQKHCLGSNFHATCHLYLRAPI
jgi:hypothetical protein